MESNKIINGNCWVVCFDILGFKDQILGYEKVYGVGKLDGFANIIYKEILNTLQKDVDKYFKDIVFTCWGSDTFVLYTPDDSIQSFSVISSVAIAFCRRMIMHCSSYMVRGALGTGQFYADKQNNIFLGSALINAYEYAEKQNWIGLVVTLCAEKKVYDLESSHNIQHHTLLYNYVKYDVPIKKKETRNGIKCIVEDTEKLYAARIQDCPGINRFFQPRSKDGPQKEWVKKYEHTREFFEKYPYSSVEIRVGFSPPNSKTMDSCIRRNDKQENK